MANLETISIKVGDREKEFLYDIAEHFKLYKRSSKDLSCTKALQFLIEFCLQNNINPTIKDDNDLHEIRKMIEQIHASVPHIMYHQNFQSVVLANKYSDDELQGIQDGSLQYINNSFAGFQNNKYRYVKSKLNKYGLKTIPLEEGNTLWK